MRKDLYLERLSKVPMFQACSKKELAAVGRRAEPVEFKDGKVLVREGDRGREVFVIVEGKVTVSRDGVTLCDLGAGEYFGELAVLDPGPRDATVTASTDGEALVMDRREFFSLLEEVPQLTLKVMVGMARRLHEADSRPVR